MIEFAIGENEYLNTDDIGINFYINSIDYKVFLNVDTFMSLCYYLQKLDLLLATQNMISIYLTNKNIIIKEEYFFLFLYE
jgi:hypothetical protein